MNNYRKDGINLKYFLPFVLYEWKIIIIAGILCGLLSGGLRVLRGVLLWDAQMETYQYYLGIYEEEYKAYEDAVSLYTERISELQQINTKSLEDIHQLTDAQNALNSLVAPVLEQEPPTIEHTLIRIVEFMIFGIMIGIAGSSYIYYYKYKRKGVIYSYKEFEKITGIYILGVFGWIKRNTKKELNRNIIERINVHIMSQKADYKKVILMGQAEDHLIQNIVKALEQNLPEIQLFLFIGSNEIENIEYMKNHNSCDAVVLVEQRAKSLIPDIIQYVELIESIDIPIIGAVVL